MQINVGDMFKSLNVFDRGLDLNMDVRIDNLRIMFSCRLVSQ